MIYKYTAFTDQGVRIDDVILAKSKEDALGRLNNRGYQVDKIRADIFAAVKMVALSSAGGVSLKDKLVFTRNLSMMVRAGMTLDESLVILSEQTTNAKLGSVLLKMHEGVQGGSTFTEVLAEYPKIFDTLFVNIISAAEKSGTLSESLDQLAAYLDRQHDMKAKVQGALFYPVLVVVATSIVGFLMTIFVLPKITRLFESLKAELPFTTRTLIALSDLITNQFIVVLAAAGAFVGAIFFLTRTQFMRPIWHWLLLNIPLSKKISKSFNLALFTRTLGTLLFSGVPINEALEITSTTLRNVHYRKALKGLVPQQQTGETLGALLRQHPHLFPPIVHRMVTVAEESGNLEEVLGFLSDFYENELDYLSKNLSSIIEPALLIVIGTMVGIVALSILTPIYQITGSFQFQQ